MTGWTAAGLIALRVLEAVFWLLLSGGIGNLVLSALGVEVSSGPSLSYTLTNFSLQQIGYALDAWPSPGQVIGVSILLATTWGLGDLPIFALVRARQQSEEDENDPWPQDQKELAQTVVRDLQERAAKSLKTARAILMLMVATLAVGMWVFVAAPGAESARTSAVKRAAQSIIDVRGTLQKQDETYRASLKALSDSVAAIDGQIKSGVGGPFSVADQSQTSLNVGHDLLDAIASARTTIEPFLDQLGTTIAQKPTEGLDSQSTLTRIGSVVILLVALKVLGGLYRSCARLAQQYSAAADALMLAIQRDAPALDSADILDVISKFTPTPEQPVDIVTPMDAMAKLADKLSDLTAKASEMTKNLAEMAKNLRPGA